MRQFVGAVPGGREHVGLRARALLHETGNWLLLTSCSNEFNTFIRTVGCAGGGGKLWAGAHADCGQVLRRETR